MSTLTISIYGNQIFSEIMKELKLFSKYSIKFYNDLDLYKKEFKDHNQLSNPVCFLGTACRESYRCINNVQLSKHNCKEARRCEKVYGTLMDYFSSCLIVAPLLRKTKRGKTIRCTQ